MNAPQSPSFPSTENLFHLHAVVGRAGDIGNLVVSQFHADVENANIEKTRVWAERRRLPVLLPDVRWAHPIQGNAGLGFERGVYDRPPRLHVEAARPVLIGEVLGHQDLAVRAIERIGIGVAVEVNERLAHFAVNRHVEQHRLVDAVIVPLVVRRELIGPLRHSGVRVAREHRARPQIVSGPLRRNARARIGRAIVDQLELRVVGDEAPRRACAGAPHVRRPGRDSRSLPISCG